MGSSKSEASTAPLAQPVEASKSTEPVYYPPPAGYPPAPQQQHQYPGGYPPQQYAYPPAQQQQYAYPPPQQQYAAPYGQMPPQQYGAPYGQQPAYVQQPGGNHHKPQGAMGTQAPGYDPEAAAAAAAAALFTEQSVRTAFVRKVMLLVAMQIAVTTGIACVFMFVKPVKNYVSSDAGWWVFLTAWILAFAMIIALTCSTRLRRRHPYNLLALLGFTVVMSVLVGAVCAYGDVQIVLIAFLTTSGVVGVVTVLAFTIKFDLTKRGHVLGAAGLMFFVAVMITVFVGIWYANKWWFLVISCIGALLFSAFLLYDLQLLIGGKKYEISPDEYIFASVQIYMDIITIFLYILSIGNIASS